MTCEHTELKEYSKRERLELVLKDMSIDCPGCGTTFLPRRDHYGGEIYLVKEEVA